MNYFGGDPRIKFVTSPDGSPLQINAYQHYVDASKGIGKEDFVDISSMNFDQVKQLLKDRGVMHKSELAAAGDAKEL